MWTFAFDAPALYHSAATRFAGQRRFAIWLRDQLMAHDVPALGPQAGKEGWALSIHADDGFVFVLLDFGGGGARPFEARVDYAGAAEVEAEDIAQAVEAILNASPAVRIVEAA
ncbi:MAG: hypothetical protein KGM15_10225 [Pseudomonadota bacterium]|nr:hypothetical protein [Pseudomonadota bacterium]